MKPFTETLRHDHPLTAEDWVLEIGAHKGYDTAIFRKNYGCRVVAYEPCEFYYDMGRRFAEESGVYLVHAGACGGDKTRIENFGVHGELSGQFAGGTTTEKVVLAPIVEIVRAWSDNFQRPPALLQLNCEGGEYDIMIALIKSGLVKTIPRVQVQFHSVAPNAKVRRGVIFDVMADTHDFLWEPGDFDTGWVGWVRK